MKVFTCVAACSWLLFCGGPTWADAPGLESGVKIKDGAVNLKLYWETNPCMVDWNNDGAKDLIVGELMNGWITLFLNQGTNLNPVFNGGAKIESNGTPITVTIG